MNQRDLNRAVAEATGETIATIAHRGFKLLGDLPAEDEREPLVVDWEQIDRHRALLSAAGA